MNVALIGYGKMGREIERIAGERKIKIGRIFTSENNRSGKGLTKQSLKGIDVCIDFSTPEATERNVKAAGACGKNIVVGTTGWYDRMKEIEKIVREEKIGLLFSANFSVGMNVFFQLVGMASKKFDKTEEYDVAIQETHHKSKTDSPSGTALTLGQIILKNYHRKQRMLLERAKEQIGKESLHVTSTRVGSAVGKHAVIFDSEADSIELVHTAKNRAGFARGALLAAEWLNGKKGWFTMNDVITSI